MNSIVPFQFNQSTVRTITDSRDGTAWFVLRDVLEAMGSSTRPSDAKANLVESLGEEVVSNYPLQTAGGAQDTIIITESGVTYLVAQSRTEAGKELNRWLHKEVLPAIRKTGAYAVATLSPAEMLVAQAQLYLEHERELQRLEQEQRAIKAQLSAMVNGEDYFTVVGFANLHRIKLDAAAAKRLGRKATAICHTNGWPVGEAKHPLYGLVGTYPIDALTEAFNG